MQTYECLYTDSLITLQHRPTLNKRMLQAPKKVFGHMTPITRDQ